MKALSVRQPFASLILAGRKVREYRNWATRHRGPIAVHAAGRLDRAALESLSGGDVAALGELPLGVVLGTVEVVGVEELAVPVMGYRFAWVLANPVAWAEPVPAKGKLMLWEFAA